ncbi:hypothetical protein [Roseicella aquatilis]|nr:hypothetical protein [Roseicella aquatilis]
MTLNLEFLATNLIIAGSIVAFVWGYVLIEERKHRIRHAREQAEGAEGKT